jgi:hypothetical protein
MVRQFCPLARRHNRAPAGARTAYDQAFLLILSSIARDSRGDVTTGPAAGAPCGSIGHTRRGRAGAEATPYKRLVLEKVCAYLEHAGYLFPPS